VFCCEAIDDTPLDVQITARWTSAIYALKLALAWRQEHAIAAV